MGNDDGEICVLLEVLEMFLHLSQSVTKIFIGHVNLSLTLLESTTHNVKNILALHKILVTDIFIDMSDMLIGHIRNIHVISTTSNSHFD